VDSIKVIPLGFAKYICPLNSSRFPTNPGYSHSNLT
jgi:hypothetical protein